MGDRRPPTPGPDGPRKNSYQRRSNSRDRADNNRQDRGGNSQVRGGHNTRRRGINSSHGNSNQGDGHDGINPRNNSDQSRGGNQGLQNQDRGGNEPFRGDHNNTHARGGGSRQRGGRQQHGYQPDMKHSRGSHNPQGAGYDPRQGTGYQPNMSSGYPPGGGPFQPGPQMGPHWGLYGNPPHPGFNAMRPGYPHDFGRPINAGPAYSMYPQQQQPGPRYPSYPAGNGLLPTPSRFPPPPALDGMFGPGNANPTPTNRGGNLGGNHGNQRGMPTHRRSGSQQHLTRSSSNMSINSIQSEPCDNRGQRPKRGANHNYGDRSNEDGRRPPNNQRSRSNLSRNDSRPDVSKSEDGARPKTYSNRNPIRQKEHSDRNQNKARPNNISTRRVDTSYDKHDQDDETISKNRNDKEVKNQNKHFEEGNTRGRGMRGNRGRSGFRRRGGRGPRRGYGYGRGRGYIGMRRKEVDETSQADSDLESCFSDVSSVVNDADQHNVIEERISDFLNSLGRREINRRSNQGRGNQNRCRGLVRGRGSGFNTHNFDRRRNARDGIDSDNDSSSRKMYRGRVGGRGRGRFDPRKKYVGNRRQESAERSDSDNEEDNENRSNVDSEDASNDDESKANVTEVASNVMVKRKRSRKRRTKSKQDDGEKFETDKNETEVCSTNVETTEEARFKSENDLASLALQTLQNRRKRYKMKLSERQKQGADQIEEHKRLEQIKAIEDELVRRKINETEIERCKTSDTNEDNDNAYDSETESDGSSSSCKHITVHRRVKSFRLGKGKISFNPRSRKTILKIANIHDSGHVERNTKKDSVPENNKPNAKDSDIKNKSSEVLQDVLSKLDELISSGSKLPTGENPEANKTKIKAKQEKMPSENATKNTNDQDKRKTTEEKDEIKNKTNSGSGKNPIATEVFAFMVKHMEGSGDPNDIKRECGMFETEFNVEQYFCAMKNFFATLKRGKHVTHVFAYMPNMSYCIDYLRAEGCLKAGCNRYHVCKDMACGNCRFGNKCKHSHNFLDEWNGKITKDLGLTGKFKNEEIATILSCRQPHVCEDWAVEQGCANEYCPKLHVCPRFIIGNCLETDSNCPFGHDYKTQHNQPIMEAYRMANWQPHIVRKLVYMKKNLTVDRNVVKEPPPVSVPKKEAPFEGIEELIYIENFPEEAVVTERTLHERDGVPKESAETGKQRLFAMDDASSKFLCMEHIHDNCYQSNCTRLHSDEPLPYLWQVKLFGDWVTLPESETVEQHFCTPGKKSHCCFVIYAEQPVRCTVEFGHLVSASISDHIGSQKTESRRLTTVPFKEAGDVADSYVTQWRWYWRDNDGLWKLFEPDSLQHTLEAKFLAKQPTYLYSRENYKWKYVIDFDSMQQRNMDTGAIRKLRRRPLFVSYRDVQDNKTPPCLDPPQVIEVELPPSWVPWDVSHPFELVQLSHTDAEFIEVSDNFYKTMSPDQHILEAVFRVQNHALLSAFCNHEKTMLNNQLRLGDRNPVDKRQLFHGTDSLDTVRGICINNFDFRLCGKNATLYGHGAYFAREAIYSDSYTKPSDKLERFMFQAKVLVGYYTTGNKEYKRPPGKPGKDHELYDSCVDKVVNPSIFILFEKNAYYPEYLIQYQDTRDRDIPLAVTPPMLRRSVVSSYSSSSISSPAVHQAPLPTAIPTPAAVASQQSYAAPQPFAYPSSSGSAPPAQPTRAARPPSPINTFSGLTNTWSSGYTSPTRTSSTSAQAPSPSGASWNQPSSTIYRLPKKNDSCSVQ